MEGVQSLNDALPVLFPQIWGGKEDRPFIRLRTPLILSVSRSAHRTHNSIPSTSV